MRNGSNEVKWAKVLWFSQNIPKHSFILWLDAQNKFMTCDRMAKWGSYDMNACSLGMNGAESHDHLFFRCPYSVAVWGSLKANMRVEIAANGWNDIISDITYRPCGNNIWTIVRRLSLAVAVYCLWRERNHMICRDERCSWGIVFEKSCESVRMRLMSLKPSAAVCQVEHVKLERIKKVIVIGDFGK